MSTPSKHRKNGGNPGNLVSLELCITKHESLAKEMGGMRDELKTIKEALVGPDLQGGLVKKVGEIDSQIKTGRTVVDWIKPIIIAVVSAGVVAAFMYFLK